MRHILTLISGILLLGCSNGREQLLRQAIELDSLKRYQEAIAIYDKLFKQDSSNATILVARAFDKGQTGDVAGEIEDLKLAARLGATYARPRFELGLIYADSGLYAESISWFNQALKAKGGGPLFMEYVKNDHVGATNEIDVWMDIAVDRILLERGIVYYKSDSSRKAHSDLTYCIDKNVHLRDSYYYRALTYLNSQMLERACEDLIMAELYGEKEATLLRLKHCP